MTTSPAQLLLRFRRLATAAAEATPDAALRERFVRGRDEDAFAALVARHGPMVWRVCRRVLGDAHAAEDAYQATFLALARRAGSVRRRDALSAWLHAVARRAALRVHAAMRRRPAELPSGPAADVADPRADPLAEVSVRELLTALDEELSRLPEVQRLPVILCCLEGKTQPEAARQLGWTPGSLQGRLERGRRRLYHRLAKRGLALSAALALVAVSRGAAGMPKVLASAIPSGEALPAGVAALADAAWRGTAPRRFHVALALLLVLGVAALGTGMAVRPRPADPVGFAGNPQERPGKGLASRDLHGDPLPAGAAARLGTLRFNHGDGLRSLFFLPDGKTVLSEGDGALRLWDAATGKEKAHFATAKSFNDDRAVLTPDGKTLVFVGQEIPGDTVRFWDVAGGKEARAVALPVRRNLFSVDFRNALSPDGRLAAVHTAKYVQVFDTATAKELYDLPQAGEAVKAVLFAGNDRLVTADKMQVVRVWEAKSGKPVREFSHGAEGEMFAASADGRRLAVLERRFRPYKLPNGDVLQLHHGDVIHVWDLAAGARKHNLEARPSRWHFHMHFATDGKFLFASTYDDDGNEPHELTVWDADSGQRVRELRGACGRVLAVSPDGTRLAEGDSGKFALWDLQTGRRLSSEDGPHALTETMMPSPAGDRVLTFGHAALHAWDGRTGRLLNSLDLPPYPYADPGRSHFFSADGRRAASFRLNDGRLEILVWDVDARRQVQTIRHPGEPKYVSAAVKNATRVFAPRTSRAPSHRTGRCWSPGNRGKYRSSASGTCAPAGKCGPSRMTRLAGSAGRSSQRTVAHWSSRGRASSGSTSRTAGSSSPGGRRRRRVGSRSGAAPSAATAARIWRSPGGR
jgi:RNA polymerase sigma factor (sigma-70 family)